MDASEGGSAFVAAPAAEDGQVPAPAPAEDQEEAEEDHDDDEALAVDARRDLKAEAKSLKHLMTHMPKNPHCSSCQRAKMTAKPNPRRIADPEQAAKVVSPTACC